MGLYERQDEELRLLTAGEWNTPFAIPVVWLLDHAIGYDRDSALERGRYRL